MSPIRENPLASASVKIEGLFRLYGEKRDELADIEDNIDNIRGHRKDDSSDMLLDQAVGRKREVEEALTDIQKDLGRSRSLTAKHCDLIRTALVSIHNFDNNSPSYIVGSQTGIYRRRRPVNS